jgi:hypothetical protein
VSRVASQTVSRAMSRDMSRQIVSLLEQLRPLDADGDTNNDRLHFLFLFLTGVWQGVAMDSLKCYPGLPCFTVKYYVSGVARPQSEEPAAVFYPFGYPKSYAYAFSATTTKEDKSPTADAIMCETSDMIGRGSRDAERKGGCQT